MMKMILAVALLLAQTLSPMDDQEAARFQAIARAVAAAGYASPAVVGHGTGATDALFALLATRGGKGVLVAVGEPAGRSAAVPIDLETDQDPAHLGIRGVQFGPFLDVPNLVDLEISHEPFMLETSRSFSRHYVLRRVGSTLARACDFDGSSRSTSSKGIGSVSQTRSITVKKIPGTATLTFDVTVVDERTERSGNGRNDTPQTERTETHKRYELPATGVCKDITPARH